MTEPLFPETSSDEREVGWGDDLGDLREDASDAGLDADEQRLRADRPPHHDRP